MMYNAGNVEGNINYVLHKDFFDFRRLYFFGGRCGDVFGISVESGVYCDCNYSHCCVTQQTWESVKNTGGSVGIADCIYLSGFCIHSVFKDTNGGLQL